MNLYTLKYKSEAISYAIVALIALCGFKIFYDMHAFNISDLADAAYGVTIGKPHWIAYQNRILGPYFILLISSIGGITFKTSLIFCTLIFFEIACLMDFFIMRLENMSIINSLFSTTIFAFLFLTFQHYWFYIWDSLDLLIFILFAHGILKQKSNLWLISLYLVAIFNRESALFIPLYMMLNAFFIDVKKLTIKLVHFKSIILGLLLLSFGALYTKWIRHALFISKADGSPDDQHGTIGNHVYFIENINKLFFHNFFDRNFIFSCILIVALVTFSLKAKKMSDSQIKCLIVIFLIFSSILIFGLANETRMYLILLPFFLFLWSSMNGNLKSNNN